MGLCLLWISTLINRRMLCFQDLLLVLIITCLLAVLCFRVYMMYKLTYPTIISYPWSFPSNERWRRRDKQMTVVLAGSYNPPHKGHLAMLSYLSERYGQVIAVIGMNPLKKYAVSPAQRAELLQQMIQKCIILKDGDKCDLGKNIRVQVVSGYIWRFAMKNQAKILYRGIRTWEKDGIEESMLHKQNLYGPMLLGPLKWPLPTYFLEGVPEYRHVSSTLIRELCEKNKSHDKETTRNTSITRDYTLLDEYIPNALTAEVAKIYGKLE